MNATDAPAAPRIAVAIACCKLRRRILAAIEAIGPQAQRIRYAKGYRFHSRLA